MKIEMCMLKGYSVMQVITFVFQCVLPVILQREDSCSRKKEEAGDGCVPQELVHT